MAGLTDVAVLRENARRDIANGAITPSYGADRAAVIDLLNQAIATEYVCSLRYYRHYCRASGMLADAVKPEFLEHAQQELAHANRLAERIVQLGGEPDLNPDTPTARWHAGSPRNSCASASPPTIRLDGNWHRRRPPSCFR